MGDLRELIDDVPVSEPLQRAINETREKIRECFRPIGKRIPATLRALSAQDTGQGEESGR